VQESVKGTLNIAPHREAYGSPVVIPLDGHANETFHLLLNRDFVVCSSDGQKLVFVFVICVLHEEIIDDKGKCQIGGCVNPQARYCSGDKTFWLQQLLQVIVGQFAGLR
jgi:hypothetical protein